MADALSRKPHCHYLKTLDRRPELAQGVRRLNLQIVPQGMLNSLSVRPTLEDQIKEAQDKDKEVQELKELVTKKEFTGFKVDEQGKLWYEDRICVPKEATLKNLILDEAHQSPYSIHPRATKMYMDLKQKYWWKGMKVDIADYVAKCDISQRIKAEHHRPADYFNLYIYQSGNGTRLVWTL